MGKASTEKLKKKTNTTGLLIFGISPLEEAQSLKVRVGGSLCPGQFPPHLAQKRSWPWESGEQWEVIRVPPAGLD